MIVCDLCGKRSQTEQFTFPTKVYYYATHNGKRVARFHRYEQRKIDLCENCARSIADLLDDMKYDNGVIETE